jgi:hypothetical protein
MTTAARDPAAAVAAAVVAPAAAVAAVAVAPEAVAAAGAAPVAAHWLRRAERRVNRFLLLRIR